MKRSGEKPAGAKMAGMRLPPGLPSIGGSQVGTPLAPVMGASAQAPVAPMAPIGGPAVSGPPQGLKRGGRVK